MLKRNWIVVTAFGLALVVASLGQAQEQSQNEQGSAAHQQSPAETLPLPGPLYVIEDEPTADARKRSEQEAAQREIDDLVAQQGMNAATQAMNDATQRMADFAYAQTWLVGIGTVLLFVTLWLTWQANQAAQNAVAVTDRIGQAQVRAYISVDPAALPKLVIGEVPECRFSVKNYGQSPALKVSVVSAVVTGTRPLPAFTGDLVRPEGRRSPPTVTLSTNEPFVGSAKGPEVLTMEQHSAVMGAEEVCLYLAGRVDYLDVFKAEHFTRFCYVLLKAPTVPGGYDWSTVGVHNDTD